MSVKNRSSGSGHPTGFTFPSALDSGILKLSSLDSRANRTGSHPCPILPANRQGHFSTFHTRIAWRSKELSTYSELHVGSQ